MLLFGAHGAVMSVGFIYWLILLLWLLLSFYWYWPRGVPPGQPPAPLGFPALGGLGIIFLLFVLLGVEVFGFPIG